MSNYLSNLKSIFAHYDDRKEIQNVEVWVVIGAYGSPKVIGNITIG